MERKYFNESSRRHLLSYIIDRRFPDQFRAELILRSLTEQLSIFIEVLKWHKTLNLTQINHVAGYLIQELKRDILTEYLSDQSEFNKSYSIQFNIQVKLDSSLEDILFRTATLLNPIISKSKITANHKRKLKDEFDKKNKIRWSEARKKKSATYPEPFHKLILQYLNDKKINVDNCASEVYDFYDSNGSWPDKKYSDKDSFRRALVHYCKTRKADPMVIKFLNEKSHRKNIRGKK